MFDDNVPSRGEAPKNLPISEPDDMFSDTEKNSPMDIPAAPPVIGASALDNGLLKKKEISEAPVPQVSSAPAEMYETKEPILGKVFIVIIIIAAAAGLGYGAWKFYMDYTESTGESLKQDEVQLNNDNDDQTVQQENQESIIEEENEVIITTTTTSTEENLVDESVLDDDKDSLNNAREKELGTDPKSADTDKDELRDGDEVNIWQTDPLNKDTDGDGYKDGEEIKNGYNPLGSGKLFSNNTTSTIATNTNNDIEVDI